MKKLTQSDVLLMTSQERKTLLDELEDLACNIDYIEEPFKSDVIQYNISLLESKVLHSEY